MLEKRFTVKNDSWKEYAQPGEVTKEGFLPPEVSSFLTQEGTNYFFYVDNFFCCQVPQEDYPTLQALIKSDAKIGLKIVAVSGKVVIVELSIKNSEQELSYLISQGDAEKLLTLCVQPIQTYSKYYFGMKKSYYSSEDPQVWWVMEYTGAYAGIKVTGVQLKSTYDELFFPTWVGQEIKGNLSVLDKDLFSLKPTKIEEVLGTPLYKRS